MIQLPLPGVLCSALQVAVNSAWFCRLCLIVFARRWFQWLSGLKDPSVLGFLHSNFLGRLWLPCPQIFSVLFFCPLTQNPNWRDSSCASAIESKTTWEGVAFCTSLFDFLKKRGWCGGWSWTVANTPNLCVGTLNPIINLTRKLCTIGKPRPVQTMGNQINSKPTTRSSSQRVAEEPTGSQSNFQIQSRAQHLTSARLYPGHNLVLMKSIKKMFHQSICSDKMHTCPLKTGAWI